MITIGLNFIFILGSDMENKIRSFPTNIRLQLDLNYSEEYFDLLRIVSQISKICLDH